MTHRLRAILERHEVEDGSNAMVSKRSPTVDSPASA